MTIDNKVDKNNIEYEKSFVFDVDSTIEKLYIGLLTHIHNVTASKELLLLDYLIKNSDEHGRISITTKNKEDICNKLKLAHVRFSSVLNSLIKKNVVKGGKGEYQLSPIINWINFDKSYIAYDQAKLKVTFELVKI